VGERNPQPRHYSAFPREIPAATSMPPCCGTSSARGFAGSSVASPSLHSEPFAATPHGPETAPLRQFGRQASIQHSLTEGRLPAWFASPCRIRPPHFVWLSWAVRYRSAPDGKLRFFNNHLLLTALVAGAASTTEAMGVTLDLDDLL